MRIAFVVIAVVLRVAAQDGDAPAPAPQGAQDAPEEGDAPAPVRCPLINASFNELSAVGQLLLSQGHSEQAEACLLEAVASTLPVLRVLSHVAANRNDFGRAAALSQLLEMMDSSADAKLLHAQRLLQNNENAAAAKRLAALLETPGSPHAESADVHHLHGIASFRLGDGAAAMRHLERAVQLQPEVAGHGAVLAEIKAAQAQTTGNDTDTDADPVVDTVTSAE